MDPGGGPLVSKINFRNRFAVSFFYFLHTSRSHSRAGGNPGFMALRLDPRLRGDDEKVAKMT